MGFHSCAPMSSAPDVHVEENGRRGEYGALPGSLSGGELSRPAGYPDGPLLRTGLAELPHPAPDRSVPPHIFSENGTLTEFSIAMGIPAF